ncbi:transposase [Streptomyces sp. 3211.6]|uniref:transposase n=1 Tax=Streptomyces sp. 3211.6 TaxID=1938845 RepID=UPI000EADFC31|nr:transposase [Streptomyces sp. 3211.6]
MVTGCWQCGQLRVAVGSSGSLSGACREVRAAGLETGGRSARGGAGAGAGRGAPPSRRAWSSSLVGTPSTPLARDRRGAELTQWMARALADGPKQIQSFATFLQHDWDVVVNGLSLPWRSGVVEGQVTRIKLIKRRSYGRASFSLLRTLVLAQPP